MVIAGIALGGCGGASDEEITQAEREGAVKEKQQQQRLASWNANRRRAQGTQAGQLRRKVRTESTDRAIVAPSGQRIAQLRKQPLCQRRDDLRIRRKRARRIRNDDRPRRRERGGLQPARNRYYTMYCTAGTPHECTGGNHAAVYFPVPLGNRVAEM